MLSITKSIVAVFMTANLIIACHADVVNSINFDEGLGDGVAIPVDFYSSYGLSLENAAWDDVRLDFGGNAQPPLAGSSPPFAIISQNTPFGSVIPPSSPIVGRFSLSVSEVTITGLDVGELGARINAYDSEYGGALIAFDEHYSIGDGVGVYETLSVSIVGIRRFELFQPGDFQSSDGLEFDNLTFTSIPEPSSVWVLSGLAFCSPVKKRNRRK